MKNTLFKFFGPDSVRKVASDDGVTRFKLLSTPFGGDGHKDVHGEWFDAKTDFGDKFQVTTKYLMYDHHLNFLLNEEADPTDLMIVGTAKFAGADEAGRWYDVELDRSHKYHDMIVKLQEQGLLGTSTQCYIGTKMVNPDTGYISRWIESEISLTPTPAGPDTLGKVYAVAKSVGLDLPDIEARLKAAANGTATAGASDAEAGESSEGEDVEAAMDALLNKTADTPEEITPEADSTPAVDAEGNVDMKSLAQQVADIHAALPLINQMKAWAEVMLRIDGVLAPPDGNGDNNAMNLQDVMRMISAAVGNLKTGQIKQSKALMKFAEFVVTELEERNQAVLKTQTRKSKLELDLELDDEEDDPLKKIAGTNGTKPRVFKSSIPDNAPGG